MVAARRIRSQIAAAMRGKHLQTREAVERPLEDQMLQGNGRVERIADRIRQPAIAFEALRKFRRALRMNEQDGAEFFGLGPNGMKFGIGKVLAEYAAADGGAPETLFLDCGLQLLHGEV